jgi:asparagine synthase (glutamine-hydrolysing)
MCGIAGMAGFADAQETQRALGLMAASMEHRGPDDEGVAIVDDATPRAVGLCARRLAIQDISPLGHQPMRSEGTGNWVALNGEIYNVAELRDRLSGLGHTFRGHSDTEVILRGYDEWGPSVVERLRGMFAFAVWDARRRRLFVARDRLGIKPLYLVERDGGLLFASELRTLLASGLVRRDVSADGVLSFLSLGALQDPHTMLAGVTALPAGHAATWDGGALDVEPYWSLEDAFRAPDTGLSREDTVEQLRETLLEAVRLHLVSDVPLGVFLSGGIDSSALVALASRASGTPPRTVSVVFPQQEYSEERFIRQIAELYGTEHTEVRLDDDGVLAEVPAAVAAMDAPTADGVNTFIVSRAAREAGLTVALSGLGGDELFGGYPSFRQVPMLARLRRLVPGPVGRGTGSALLRLARNDREDKLARWLRNEDGGAHPYTVMRQLFGPDAARRLTGGSAARWELPPLTGDPVDDVSLLELSVYMRNVLLRDSDVMSMAHSLEIRVPLVDHVLVERAAAADARWKDGSGTPKALLVDALGDDLPSEVVNRPKMGFTLPYEHWLRGPLRERVSEALNDPDHGGQVAAMLDGDEVRAVWRRFEEGRGQWLRPWSLYALKAWGEAQLPSAGRPSMTPSYMATQRGATAVQS